MRAYIKLRRPAVLALEAVAIPLLLLLSMSSFAAGANTAPTEAVSRIITSGDLLALDEGTNTLLAFGPKGEAKTNISLIGTKKGPIDVDGFPSDGKRKISQVFAGAVSRDGKYAFNTANVNKPVNKNTSDDGAYLVVTDLATAKVVGSYKVPPPGLPQGTEYNFQSDFFPPADNGDAESNLGYTARRYISAGAPSGTAYPLYMIISAFSCHSAKSDGGTNMPSPRQKQQFFTKYSYDAMSKKLTWSSARVLLSTECATEGAGLLNGTTGRALGAFGPNGYLVAANGGPPGIPSGPIEVYRLKGDRLASVYKFVDPSQLLRGCNYFSLLRGAHAKGGVLVSALCNDDKQLVLFGNKSQTNATKVSLASGYFSAAIAPAKQSGTLYIASFYGAGPAGRPSHIDKAMLLNTDARLGRLGTLKRAFEVPASTPLHSIVVVP